ncbi:MAG: hypothetical protein EOP86_10805 [Verrucomicrobiaceae bacterium]|nr:MAG: hypothetical protein EOP86_10805 [Verrucomicrobiaceae bacterium]
MSLPVFTIRPLVLTIAMAAGSGLFTTGSAAAQEKGKSRESKPKTEAAIPADSGKPAEAPAPEPEGRSPGGKPVVPDDLLEDEHLREEYGVNQFTTPSIRRIFGQLEALGTLPYDKLKRPLPKSTASDRSLVALSLGVLIGDGFLSVQSEKVSDLEDIGRAVLKHAKTLGAGARITEHAKSLLENSALGDWKTLREDLAGTQKDVEGEMVLLRDMEVAHLISLGGWLRGMQIASGTAMDPFSPEHAALLARADLLDYFNAMLAELNPTLQKRAHIKTLRASLEELHSLISLPEGKAFTEEQVKTIYEKSSALVKLVTSGN